MEAKSSLKVLSDEESLSLKTVGNQFKELLSNSQSLRSESNKQPTHSSKKKEYFKAKLIKSAKSNVVTGTDKQR